MNFLQTLTRRLDPIPPEYNHLAAAFDAQGKAFLRRWIVPAALLGGLMTLAYIPLPFVLYQNTQAIVLPLYIAIFSCYLLVSAIFYYGQEKVNIDLTIFAAWTVVSLLSFAAMRVTNDYTSASGIFVLTVVAYAGLIPWPAHLTVWFYGIIGAVYGLMGLTLGRQDNWIDYIIMGVLLLIVIFIFGAAYGLLVRLRWQNFLNEQLIKAANFRLQEDLTLAQDIQRQLLPSPNPEWPHFDVVCYTAQAREVGGDLYNYHSFNHAENRNQAARYAVAVGDVSGKGLPAALLMATSLAHFNALLKEPLTPAERLVQLDQTLIPYTESSGHNCALCYVEINAAASSDEKWPSQNFQLCTVNAGCIPPYLKRRNGAVEWLEARGLPLGVGLGLDFGYQEISAALSAGDMVIMTSDGVPEANNALNDIFGFERLKAAIAAGPTSSAQAMLDHLRNEIGSFVGQAEPHDDLTIVVLRALEE